MSVTGTFMNMYVECWETLVGGFDYSRHCLRARRKDKKKTSERQKKKHSLLLLYRKNGGDPVLCTRKFRIAIARPPTRCWWEGRVRRRRGGHYVRRAVSGVTPRPSSTRVHYPCGSCAAQLYVRRKSEFERSVPPFHPKKRRQTR